MQLEAHNLQLKNIISKKNNDAEQISSAGVNKKQFDFKK